MLSRDHLSCQQSDVCIKSNKNVILVLQLVAAYIFLSILDLISDWQWLHQLGVWDVSQSSYMNGEKKFTTYRLEFTLLVLTQPRVIYTVDDVHQYFAVGSYGIFVEQVELAMLVTRVIWHSPPKPVTLDGVERFSATAITSMSQESIPPKKIQENRLLNIFYYMIYT